MLALSCGVHAHAGFHEAFDGPRVAPAWTTQTGDGDARLAFSQSHGRGLIEVDARSDQRNIWWALIRHPVTPAIDAREIASDDRELRVEARVRTDTAPRRINLHLNHSRTTDFHSHLREFDLPVLGEWQVVSMTTQGFDARAGDDVYVQLALMDWGTQRYVLEIDYIKVELVDPSSVPPDRGAPLPYRPDVPPPGRYRHALPVLAASTVDREWPRAAARWSADDGTAETERLVVGPTELIVLRWSFAGLATASASGWGVLELETETVLRAETRLESFNELRLAELLLPLPPATTGPLNYRGLLAGRSPQTVINEQPVIDWPPAAPGSTTLIPVSPPVLNRLLSGRSHGLVLLSHGGVIASFRASGSSMPRLHFNTMSAADTAAEGDPKHATTR